MNKLTSAVIVSSALALALTGCSAFEDAAQSRELGRSVVRDASGGELDNWSDKQIDEAADEICDVVRKGKDVTATDIYLALKGEELKGVSSKTAAVLVTYARRYEC